MLRVARIITVIVLGALTGCRAAPPATVVDTGDQHAETFDSRKPKSPRPGHPVRTVGFQQPPAPTAAGSTRVPWESPLTLADLEAIALGSNPTLAAAAARVRAARARQIQAGRFPNPVVGYHATEIGNQGTAGQQGGFISQRFITGGKLPLDQAVAGAQVDEALYGLRSQEQRVLNDVRVSYYNALVAQRRVDSQCRPDGERPAPQRHRRRRGQRTGRRADTDI